MKLFERIMVFLLSFFWAILLFWLTNSGLFFLLPVVGFFYLVLGGMIHA